MLRSAILLFFLLLFGNPELFSQSGNCIPLRYSQNAIFYYPQIHKDSNIVYATSKNFFADTMEQLTMDVYYPDLVLDSLPDRPIILLIHQGSFLSGTKENMDYLCKEYACRGYVAITINYRKGWNCPDSLLPCQSCQSLGNDLKTATYEAAQDARAALRYVYANASSWNADPNWIFIGGISAGAISCYHAAFWDQAEANAFAPWAVSQVGTLDTAGNSLPSNYSVRGIIDVCGAVSNDSTIINNGTIPLISFHDEFDCTVPDTTGPILGCGCQPYYPVSGSHLTTGRLSSLGACTEENVLLGSLGHCNFPAVTVIERSSCFLKRIMCNACISSFNTDSFAIAPCDSLGTAITESGLGLLSMNLVSNPYENSITLHFSEPTHRNARVHLYNSLGQLIFISGIPFGSSSTQVETAALGAGLYFLVFDDDAFLSRKKIIIAR